MKHEEFLARIEQYYEVYKNSAVRDAVYDFIFEKLAERELDYVLKSLTKEFSQKWKMAPGIAEINSVIEKSNDGLPRDFHIGIGNSDLKAIENQCLKKLE